MDSLELLSQCTHAEIINGVCSNCSQVLTEYVESQSSYNDNKNTLASFENDLQKVNVHEQVRVKALQIYEQIMAVQNYPTYRGTNRLKLIFFCVYQAEQEIGNHTSPQFLARCLGLTNKAMSNALSMCSYIQTGYATNNHITSARDRILHIAQQLKMSDHAISHNEEVAEKLCYYNTVLDDDKPRLVACAILILYMQLNGIKYDEATVCQIISIKNMDTLNPILERVKESYNQIYNS